MPPSLSFSRKEWLCYRCRCTWEFLNWTKTWKQMKWVVRGQKLLLRNRFTHLQTKILADIGLSVMEIWVRKDWKELFCVRTKAFLLFYFTLSHTKLIFHPDPRGKCFLESSRPSSSKWSQWNMMGGRFRNETSSVPSYIFLISLNGFYHDSYFSPLIHYKKRWATHMFPSAHFHLRLTQISWSPHSRHFLSSSFQ